jgi:hypothetical protein
MNDICALETRDMFDNDGVPYLAGLGSTGPIFDRGDIRRRT